MKNKMIVLCLITVISGCAQKFQPCIDGEHKFGEWLMQDSGLTHQTCEKCNWTKYYAFDEKCTNHTFSKWIDTKWVDDSGKPGQRCYCLKCGLVNVSW